MLAHAHPHRSNELTATACDGRRAAAVVQGTSWSASGRIWCRTRCAGAGDVPSMESSKR